MHEHQHWDRDATLEFRCANFIGTKPQFDGPGALDMQSIMLYDSFSFSHAGNRLFRARLCSCGLRGIRREGRSLGARACLRGIGCRRLEMCITQATWLLQFPVGMAYRRVLRSSKSEHGEVEHVWGRIT